MTDFTDRHGIRHALPAPEIEAQVRADDRGHVFHSWSAQAQIDPMPVAAGEGSTFWDYAGNAYLDFSSQLVNLNLGHQHPDLVAAIVAGPSSWMVCSRCASARSDSCSGVSEWNGERYR